MYVYNREEHRKDSTPQKDTFSHLLLTEKALHELNKKGYNLRYEDAGDKEFSKTGGTRPDIMNRN